MINVTQPGLPPLEEFMPYLEKIWESKWLTNNGPFHQQFEKELADYLGVPYISVFANGTLALLTALQALDIKGEVITTPYSFVATTHCLNWNGITPVFVDVDPVYGNMDPGKMETAITENTTAILPVHVYGNICPHNEIEGIAKKYGLKLIYDAAHCFGVKKNGISALNYGDLSVLSFHATKVFHTFEGGAVICHSREMKQHIDDLKNFGFRNEVTVIASGINAKMNEFQAAFGLLELKYIDERIKKRNVIAQTYRDQLKNFNGIRLLDDQSGVQHNFGYFPVMIDQDKFGKSRDDIYEMLKGKGYYARRYFYPLISEFGMYASLPSASKENLHTAMAFSRQVLCLPIFPDLNIEEVKKMTNLILN